MLPELSPETLQMITSSGPILLMVVFFYFIIYRPQKKEQGRRTEMLNNLKKGDRVVTTSGMYGTITAIDAKKITLKVADKLEIDFLRAAVHGYQADQTGK